MFSKRVRASLPYWCFPLPMYWAATRCSATSIRTTVCARSRLFHLQKDLYSWARSSAWAWTVRRISSITTYNYAYERLHNTAGQGPFIMAAGATKSFLQRPPGYVPYHQYFSMALMVFPGWQYSWSGTALAGMAHPWVGHWTRLPLHRGLCTNPSHPCGERIREADK